MSDHQTSPLRPEDEVLLQAALSDPFSVPNIRRLSASQPTESAPSTDPTANSTSTTSATTPAPVVATAAVPAAAAASSSSFMSGPVSIEEKEAWKVEYEEQVADWRRDSAAVRARAEVERARWEERRAHERQVAAALSGGGQSANSSASASEWEAVSSHAPTAYSLASGVSSSSGVADVRGGGGGGGGSLSGQVQSSAFSQVPPTQRQGQANNLQSNVPGSTTTSGTQPSRSAPSAAAGTAGTDPTDSPHWENVPSSIASSFPSLSFPEPSRPHSPEHPHSHAAPPGAAPMIRPVTAASTTLAVFDDTLPIRSRFLALLSSLSINLFLPFVNGVMLGFGEIFAKTVIVGWFGWGPAVATNVGLGQGGQSRNKWWGR